MRIALLITLMSGVSRLAVSLCLLLPATYAVAQTPAGQSFNDWFWNSIDWHSFGSAALCGLMGGAVRTMTTLRSMQPTFRVFLETVGDSITALVSGFVVFLVMLAYQSYFHQVNHVVTFVIAFLAGFMRGGFITWFDDAIKRVLAAVTDGVVGWVIAKGAALAAKQSEIQPPKDAP